MKISRVYAFRIIYEKKSGLWEEEKRLPKDRATKGFTRARIQEKGDAKAVQYQNRFVA